MARSMPLRGGGQVADLLGEAAELAEGHRGGAGNVGPLFVRLDDLQRPVEQVARASQVSLTSCDLAEVHVAAGSVANLAGLLGEAHALFEIEPRAGDVAGEGPNPAEGDPHGRLPLAG